MIKHRLEVTDGVVGGMTIQFAEGTAQRGSIGPGVAMSDEAFDFIVPFVEAACANWTTDHRYGAFELTLPDRKRLVGLLKDAAPNHSQSTLLDDLADWLGSRCKDARPVSILGF